MSEEVICLTGEADLTSTTSTGGGEIQFDWFCYEDYQGGRRAFIRREIVRYYVPARMMCQGFKGAL